MNVFELQCKICGHTWVKRKKEEPISCPNPKCHSPFWKTGKQKKEEEALKKVKEK